MGTFTTTFDGASMPSVMHDALYEFASDTFRMIMRSDRARARSIARWLVIHAGAKGGRYSLPGERA